MRRHGFGMVAMLVSSMALARQSDHRDEVAFRNIDIRELALSSGTRR
jgi:hypothetical protein